MYLSFSLFSWSKMFAKSVEKPPFIRGGSTCSTSWHMCVRFLCGGFGLLPFFFARLPDHHHHHRGRFEPSSSSSREGGKDGRHNWWWWYSCWSLIPREDSRPIQNLKISKSPFSHWMLDGRKKKRKHTQTLNPNTYISLLVFVFSLHRVFSPK